MILRGSVYMYIEAKDVMVVAQMIGEDEWNCTVVTLWHTWNESECAVWLKC